MKLPPRLWTLVKAALAVAIIAAVGWQFAHIFLWRPELWEYRWHLRPGWLVLAAFLYLAGLATSALFWHRLLCALGEQPRLAATIRAYYAGQPGRYVPGKVVGVVLRTWLLVREGVSRRVGALAVIYESLTTNAAGLLVAGLLFTLRDPDQKGMSWWALVLLPLLFLPLLPSVFNRIVWWVWSRRPDDGPQPPPLKGRMLAAGLVLTGSGWALQGLGLSAVVKAVEPRAAALTWQSWMQDTAFLALAQVAGFLVVIVPSGLAVREYLLQHFLAGSLAAVLGHSRAAALSVVAVLLLRLLWTVADLVAAGVAYCIPISAGVSHFTAARSYGYSGSRRPCP